MTQEIEIEAMGNKIKIIRSDKTNIIINDVVYSGLGLLSYNTAKKCIVLTRNSDNKPIGVLISKHTQEGLREWYLAPGRDLSKAKFKKNNNKQKKSWDGAEEDMRANGMTEKEIRSELSGSSDYYEDHQVLNAYNGGES